MARGHCELGALRRGVVDQGDRQAPDQVQQIVAIPELVIGQVRDGHVPAPPLHQDVAIWRKGRGGYERVVGMRQTYDTYVMTVVWSCMSFGLEILYYIKRWWPRGH